jgi:hypothetical protein
MDKYLSYIDTNLLDTYLLDTYILEKYLLDTYVSYMDRYLSCMETYLHIAFRLKYKQIITSAPYILWDFLTLHNNGVIRNTEQLAQISIFDEVT